MLLSIIIPNYNGAPFIKSLCRALVGQTLPSKEYEIIFVDNGSTDESLTLIKGYYSVLPNLCVISYTEQQSSYSARNYGVNHSQGEVLVFTDVDCQPQADWLARISEIVIKQSGDFLLTGKVKLFPAGEDFNLYEWYDMLFSLNQENYAKSQTGATANLVVTRIAYERVNGFLPLVSGGDSDFCRRVIAAGSTAFHYCPEITVFHPVRGTIEEIKKKFSRVSKGIAVLNFQKLSRAQRLYFICKQILGLFFQPHQVRQIVKTLVDA